MEVCALGVLHVQYRLALIPAWISRHIHWNVRDEITYLFPNFNGCTVEVWEWMSNFIPNFTVHVITYPLGLEVSYVSSGEWLLWVHCLINTLQVPSVAIITLWLSHHHAVIIGLLSRNHRPCYKDVGLYFIKTWVNHSISCISFIFLNENDCLSFQSVSLGPKWQSVRIGSGNALGQAGDKSLP